jgi:peptidoglycan/LPS O-acetylase OafA/YrhL
VGAKGVDIFFIISGFVMVISSRSLITPNDGWKIFLKKRLIRIVPLYWAATSLKLFILLLMSSLVLHANLDGWVIIKSYFFM